MSRIDIQVLANDNYGPHYFMHEIAEVWTNEGFDVRLLRGVGNPVDADLVVLHTDTTFVPIDYLAAVRAYPKALNGHTADISKRTVSRNLVRRPGDYDGEVIIKTDRNSGSSYRIFESPEQVPEDVWASKDWVVEKFLPERREGMYCLRTWLFLGDREINLIGYSHDPIVKQWTVVRRDPAEEAPDGLRELREELAFDFGKFDYAMVDGEVVLYDANRTPILGSFTGEEWVPRYQHLAEGVQQFL